MIKKNQNMLLYMWIWTVKHLMSKNEKNWLSFLGSWDHNMVHVD